MLGLKQNQIYKWNWDMQRKLAENKGNDASITAPDISDHISGRKVSDWTGEMGEVDNMMQEEEFASSHPNGGAQSHQDAADKNADEDSLMSEEKREL
jgi:hypothetical protein